LVRRRRVNLRVQSPGWMASVGLGRARGKGRALRQGRVGPSRSELQAGRCVDPRRSCPLRHCAADRLAMHPRARWPHAKTDVLRLMKRAPVERKTSLTTSRSSIEHRASSIEHRATSMQAGSQPIDSLSIRPTSKRCLRGGASIQCRLEGIIVWADGAVWWQCQGGQSVCSRR
jgi:hypothetical protein